VFQNTFVSLFWSTDSYVDHGMRMTVSSMLFVLIATPLGWHGGSGLVIHSGHPPLIVTHLIHEYHVNIRWISVPSCGFHDRRWVGEIWDIWCASGCLCHLFVDSSLPSYSRNFWLECAQQAPLFVLLVVWIGTPFHLLPSSAGPTLLLLLRHEYCATPWSVLILLFFVGD
jgi:hypothetical protein